MVVGERPSPQRSRPSAGLLFCILCGLLLVAFNQTILTTALPSIAGDLEGIDRSGWLIAGFLLTSTASIPVYGALSDRHGRRGFFLTAVTVFTVASLAAAFAPTMDMLIALRLVQGVGGGGLLVLSQALLADAVPVEERPRYAGALGTVWAVASLTGPLLGGLFSEQLGWQWCFLFNVPLGIAVALIGHRVLPRGPAVLLAPARVDAGGIIALAVLTAGVVLLTAVDFSARDAHAQWVPLTVICVVALGLLLVIEPRVSAPILPPAVVRRRDFVLATVAAASSGGVAMFALIAYLPVYLQLARGLSATEAGLLSSPMICALLLVSWLGGRRAGATGRFRLLTVGGCLISGAALLVLGALPADAPVGALILATVLFGAGLGAITQLLLIVAQASAPQAMVGSATAATTYIRQVGAAAGIAGTGALMSRALLSDEQAITAVGAPLEQLAPDTVAGLDPALQAVVRLAYHEALSPQFLALAPFCLCAAICLLFLRRRSFHDRDRETVDDEGIRTP